jgi:hypothetical protein
MTITIENRQDTAIRFWYMSCSWPVDNCWTSNDFIYGLVDCSKNIPKQAYLLPHQSISFDGILKGKNTMVKKPFKLGFVYFKTEEELMSSMANERPVTKFNTYWSKPLILENNLPG